MNEQNLPLGLIEARRRVCHRCEHWRVMSAEHARWPFCIGGDAQVDLSPEFLAGLHANCPLDRWRGVEPADLAAERAEAERRAAERQAEWMVPILAAALKRILSAEEKGAFLVDLVAAGRLRRDLAEETARREQLMGGTADERRPMTLHDQLLAAEQKAAALPARAHAAPEWCVFATRAGCCSKKYECRRLAGIVRVVPQVECNPNCPRAVPSLKIGAVITAFNEGDEVRATVESLLGSVRGDRTEVRVVLVDDGSTDGSCDGFGEDDGRVVVVHHEEPQGIGRSRNEGAARALELGANVVTFHDAHMRFDAPPDWPHAWGPLEHLARRALQDDAIVCSGTRGLKEGSNRSWVCDLFYNSTDGLQAKWRHVGGRQQPTEEWPESPCMMGAGYVLSADTLRKLSGATGALWEDTAGRWGFSEQALSVKAFLMRIPVRFSRDVWLPHLYRDKNPVPAAGTEHWKNVAVSMRRLLGPEVFDDRFQAFCEARLGADGLAEVLAGVEGGEPAWRRDPLDVFEMLCGKRAVPGREHPELAALAEALYGEGTAEDAEGAENGRERQRTAMEGNERQDTTTEGNERQEAARDKIVTPGRSLRSPRPLRSNLDEEPGRVLVWRPGEHLLWLRKDWPEAEITCLDFDRVRMSTWRPWCKAHKVHLIAVPPKSDYVERPLAWGMHYDLIVIAGAVQDRCKAVAERLLAPGGRIVLAASGLREQVADEHRKEEDTWADKLAKALGPNPARAKRAAQDKPASVSVRADTPPLVTIALLNYRRPGNILTILDHLADQAVPVQVYLWDNSTGILDTSVTCHPLVKLYIAPNLNLGCFPRWQMLAWADTEFVGTIDDDLCPGPELIGRAVAACRERCPDGLVGGFGMNPVEGKSYKAAQHIHLPKEDRRVEIVKGRFMLFRRALLERVPLSPPAWSEGEPMAFRCDDIYLSLTLGRGEATHLVPGSLRGQCHELGGQQVALAAQRGHYELRGLAFEFLNERTAP